jgi:hypothetical protein
MNYPRQYIGITGFALGSDTVATLEIRSLHVEDTTYGTCDLIMTLDRDRGLYVSPWFENPLFRDFCMPFRTCFYYYPCPLNGSVMFKMENFSGFRPRSLVFWTTQAMGE